MTEKTIRLAILHAATPVTKVLGKATFWWLTRYVDEKDVALLRSRLQPGDALLSAIRWELSNVLIDGFWGHEAIYAGGGKVIEAVGTGVREVTLEQFCKGKDYVSAWRPNFASEAQKRAAVAWCRTKIGLPYDWVFEYGLTGNRAFYCAELYGAAYIDVVGGQCDFLARPVMGADTFVPQDTANATGKFGLVAASSKTFEDRILDAAKVLRPAA